MIGVLRRGLVAGAVGTTVIDAATWLDMAIRGRPASQVPQRTVEAGLHALGVDVPGSKAERDHRTQAFGALSGIGAGLGVGRDGEGARWHRAVDPLVAVADVPTDDDPAWRGAVLVLDAGGQVAGGLHPYLQVGDPGRSGNG